MANRISRRKYYRENLTTLVTLSKAFRGRLYDSFKSYGLRASKEYKKAGGTWRKVSEDRVAVSQDDIIGVLEYMLILDAGNEIVLSEQKAENLKSLIGSISKKLGFAGSGRKNLISLLSSKS